MAETISQSEALCDRRIRNQQEFAIKWEYIRQNPVKANLVTKAEDYPFLWEIF